MSKQQFWKYLPPEDMPFFTYDNVYFCEDGYFTDFEGNLFCSCCGVDTWHLHKAGLCPNCEHEIKKWVTAYALTEMSMKGLAANPT